MPNLTRHSNGPEEEIRRYKVSATGEVGAVVSPHGSQSISRYGTMGPDLNVHLMDICLDATGEVRTYRAEYLEPIAE